MNLLDLQKAQSINSYTKQIQEIATIKEILEGSGYYTEKTNQGYFLVDIDDSDEKEFLGKNVLESLEALSELDMFTNINDLTRNEYYDDYEEAWEIDFLTIYHNEKEFLHN